MRQAATKGAMHTREEIRVAGLLRAEHTPVERFMATASVFDELYRTSSLGTLPFEGEQTPNWMLHEPIAQLNAGDSVLSLGAGRALLEESLALSGMSVTAVDFSAQAVAQTRQRIIDGQISGLTAQYADMTTYQIRGEYKAILSISAMHWLELDEKQKVMKNMMAHTQPGGFNFIVVVVDSAISSISSIEWQALAVYAYPKWKLSYSEIDGSMGRDKFGVLVAHNTEHF